MKKTIAILCALMLCMVFITANASGAGSVISGGSLSGSVSASKSSGGGSSGSGSYYSLTLYVSSTAGSDENSGDNENSAFKTLSEAYKHLSGDDCEIILLDDVPFNRFESSYPGTLTIRGNAYYDELIISGDVYLKGNLTLDNLTVSGENITFYAGGYSLNITSDVESEIPMSVFGGGKYDNVDGDTDITLLGGKYSEIYGGGLRSGVNGSTHILFGGMAEAESIYGGGRWLDGTVTGGTYVECTGGECLNLFGGSNMAELNCDTHVYITRGDIDSVYGGSENASVQGNTIVTIKRINSVNCVYTGCANLNSANSVTGMTVLELYPLAKENAEYNLGSQSVDGESNTVIYLNGCYNTFHNCVSGTEKYTVKATSGGMVEWAGAEGSFAIMPSDGYYGTVNGIKRDSYVFETFGVLDVSFIKYPAESSIKSCRAYRINNGNKYADVYGSADIALSEEDEAKNKRLYIAVKDNYSGGLVKAGVLNVKNGNNAFRLNACTLSDRSYTVKFMIFDDLLHPLVEDSTILDRDFSDSVISLANKDPDFIFSDEVDREYNPNGWMAHNLYSDPVLDGYGSKYTGFSIDFMTENDPVDTYWSLCNWNMDISSVKAKYPGAFGGGAYAGLQNIGKDDYYVAIMAFWDIRDGNNVISVDEYGNKTYALIQNVRRLYPAGGDDSFGGEGEGTHYVGHYPWERAHWYRMMIRCYEDAEIGNTVVDQWIMDLETGEWTLLSKFDTKLQNSYFTGAMSQFMENFIGGTSCKLRTVRLKNIFIRERGSSEWKPVTKTKLNTDTQPSHRPKGTFAFGSDGEAFWGATNGYGNGNCDDPSYSPDYTGLFKKVYSVNPPEFGFSEP
ncbi:MAG: DUF3472 domain-containing protein [Clostridia bacterium]|nr:DUF3472 domain-containing protein [Clostridia bacterium]